MSSENPSIANSIALTGEFGIITAIGPFDFQSEGTTWEVSIPLDEDDYGHPGRGAVSALSGEPEAYAVCIVDGEPHLGGRVEGYYEPEDGESLLITVDQYPMGGHE